MSRQARVTAFLRKLLAQGAQDVLTLEAVARTDGLLGDRQRITHAKAFKRAKYSLRIRSVRAGFGRNGGWRWEVEDVMASGTKWIAVYSTLVTFLVLAWAYIPA